MAQADLIFKENLREIMKQEWVEDNRAKWEDGSPIKTKRIFGVVNRYDLSKEFPILTLRKHNIKSCFKETSWIYQKQSNNVDDLGLRIWDSWADENRTIGSAYGYQISKPILGYDNQVDYILNEIVKNPTSRRLVIELWNPEESKDMGLLPCLHHVQFLVETRKDKPNKLNMLIKQRSADTITANNWNVVQYALLAHMVARHTDCEVGTLTHVIGDMHIYNKHEEHAIELLNREPLPAPQLKINEDVTDFYEFTEDDFTLVDYNYQKPQLKIDVAI